MTTTTELIKAELEKNVIGFTSEIDLLFEYIPKNIISKMKTVKYTSNFIKGIKETLQNYESDLSFVLFTKQKYKTPRLNFMNDIKLKFGTGKIDLSLFNSENKNTKKNLLKYVYNIYMTCLFLDQGVGEGEFFNEQLSSFVDKIQAEVDQYDVPTIEDIEDFEEIPTLLTPTRMLTTGPATPIGMPNMEDMMSLMSGLGAGLGGSSGPSGQFGGVENLMGSLLGNSDILGIAKDIADQMKNDNVNPMDMITSLMSGQQNDQMSKLVSNIQEKVEGKIASGEIDEEAFKSSAMSMLGNVNGGKVPENEGDLADIMKNLLNPNGGTPPFSQSQDQ
jgi:hypothetical protein